MNESFETILNHILSQNPTLPKEELLSLVERKKQESHGLLSDEGAIILLAQQMSLSALSTEEVGDLRVSSVQAGLSDASISGEVVSVSDPSAFQRADGSAGKVLRIRLADLSGQIMCVLWDDLADLVGREGLGQGSRVRFEHGYTRYGRAGEVEFHLGSRSSVQVLSLPVPTPRKSGPVKIAELANDTSHVGELRIRVRRIIPGRSEKGPVQALCEDETGLVIVKFWDEAAQAALEIQEGSSLTIQGARVAERNGLAAVNVGSDSSIRPEPGESIGSPSPVPIASLREDKHLRLVAGKVVERSEIREIETREGRRTRVSNIRIEDTSGKIRVALWDQHADVVDTLRLGDTVKLAGVRTRKGYTGDLEASTVFLSQVEKV